MTKVSVLLSTYNHERFIAQAVESALMQQVNFDYEVIILEDCSQDRTREIVIDYGRHYPDKIRLCLPEKNLGANRNFATAIRECKSAYFASLDGDDFWTSPHKLQIQADFLDRNSSVAMCTHGMMAFYEDRNGKTLEWNPLSPDNRWTLEDILEENFIPSCSSTMIRTRTLKDLPDWYEISEFGDWELYILSARHGDIGTVGQILGTYRIHRGGVWSGTSRIQQLEQKIACHRRINRYFDHCFDHLIQHSVSRKYIVLAQEHRKARDAEKTEFCVQESAEARIRLMKKDIESEADSRLVGEQIRTELKRSFHQSKAARLLESFRFRIFSAKVLRTIRQFKRRLSGSSSGKLKANPDFVTSMHFLDSDSIQLNWDTKGVSGVDLRIGSSGGPILIQGGPSGKYQTARWIYPGLSIYLQDASLKTATSTANTLDCIVISKRSYPLLRALRWAARQFLPLSIQRMLRTLIRASPRMDRFIPRSWP